MTTGEQLFVEVINDYGNDRECSNTVDLRAIASFF